MAKRQEDVDSFYAHVIILGNSLGIIIPSNVTKFAGLDKGDKLKIWVRKEKK